MKAYSIGRESGCDIVIYDSTDVVSRRHAVLNVHPNGKMFIVDQSRNGTYVNGIRVTPNVPVPVSRKDIISFAHVVKLDWSQVPATNLWMQVAAWVVGVLLLAAIGIGAYHLFNKPVNPEPKKVEAISLEDSIKKSVTDSIAKADSLAKIKADSIAKVKSDSIANEAKKKADAKKKAEEKKKKEEENKKKAKKDSTRTRVVG